MSAPRRVISLVPSLTELVYSLGCGTMLVGRTRFCTEPADTVERVPIVGGTKNPSIQRIVSAAPDLVIANKEENRRADIEALQEAGLNVLLTDPNDVQGAMVMIREIGAALGAVDPASALVSEIEGALDSVAPGNSARVFVPIWYNPLMALGTESYGSDLLARCGGTNVVQQPRYPGMNLDQVAQLAPDIILLPDEPFPFDASHEPIFAPLAPVRRVDGKLLWWYGPRMPGAIREISAMLANIATSRQRGEHRSET